MSFECHEQELVGLHGRAMGQSGCGKNLKYVVGDSDR